MGDDDPKPPLLPPEAFNTPELKRKLGEALLKSKSLRLRSDHFDTLDRRRKLKEAIQNKVRARYPRFWEALKADVAIYSRYRGEPRNLDSRSEVLRGAVELAWRTDAFLGLALYRTRTRLLARGVPVLPQLLHHVCIAWFQINIGGSVVMQPGIYVPHGQIVLDGDVEVGRNVTLGPWITVGLIGGKTQGPKIGDGVSIGSGAKLVGPISIGDRARIGANAVVNKDVPPRRTAAGVPARVIEPKNDDPLSAAVIAKRARERAETQAGGPSKE